MTRTTAAVIASTFLLLAVGTADGFWVDECCMTCNECKSSGSTLCDCYNELNAKRQENNLWPQQFVGLDRCRAKAPFDTMIQNGWRRQNLIGAHHFNDDSTQLTESGKLRVMWALTQAPQQHRQVFVERSLKENQTGRRVEVVTTFANQLVGESADSLVSETHIISDGRPASVVDYVNTAFQANMPIPQLPESSFEGLDAAE